MFHKTKSKNYVKNSTSNQIIFDKEAGWISDTFSIFPIVGGFEKCVEELAPGKTKGIFLNGEYHENTFDFAKYIKVNTDDQDLLTVDPASNTKTEEGKEVVAFLKNGRKTYVDKDILSIINKPEQRAFTQSEHSEFAPIYIWKKQEWIDNAIIGMIMPIRVSN